MNRPTVLVIEDDVAIREGLREFLEFEGFRVLSAENGRQGLEAIREVGGKCVVLLDLQMPEMSGEDLIEALRNERDPAVRAVPILVLSARVEAVRPEGVLGFIRKPVDLERLLVKVTAASSGA